METKFTNDYKKLEDVNFVDVMQCYRICEQSDQSRVIQRFEDVKEYIKENFVPKTPINSKAPEMFEMLVNVLKENHCTPDLDKQIEQLLKEATEL